MPFGAALSGHRFGRSVAVVGVGFSEIARRSSRRLASLTIDAIGAALDDAGLVATDVDGLATFPDIPVFGVVPVDGVDIVTVHLMARQFGLTSSLRWHCQGDALIQNTFVEAVMAVASGAAETVVVFRAMHNPAKAGSYNAFTSSEARGGSQFSAPYGVHRGYQTYGQAYHRYLHEYGADRAHMAALVGNARKNAQLNEHAYFRGSPEVTVADYLGARMLADPVCLLDCDIPVDGAVAMVLTPGARARGLRHRAAFVAGFGQTVGAAQATTPVLSTGNTLAHIEATGRSTADLMWSMSGLSAADIDVAQLYDGYSFFMYWWLEALGFCGRGEAFEFVQEGRVALDGRLPVNTFGGALGEGRLHGIGHLAEAALQVSGRAGARQVPGAATAVAAVGPLDQMSAAFAFTSEEP